MGSFNQQCAISRETIGEGDKVVSFLLEPEMNEQGEDVYKLGSLPVYGIYSDYGRVRSLSPGDAPIGQELAIEVANKLYGYDYSEEAVENYPEHISRGGGKSAFDTKTVQWMIKQEAYDGLWSEVSNTEILELLKAGQIETAFANKIDKDLIALLHEMDKTSVNDLADAAQLIKGLQQLNVPLGLQTSICSQFAMNDYNCRKSLHAGLIKAEVGKDKTSEAKARYTCMVSGHALAPGETAYLIPIIERRSRGDMYGNGHVNTHQVDGMYEVCTTPIRCNVDSEGKLQPQELTERHISWTTVGTEYEVEDIEKEFFVEDVLSGKFVSEIFHSKHGICGAIISEQAYGLLSMGKSAEIVQKDYQIFCDAAALFEEAWSLHQTDKEKAEALMVEQDLYRDAKLSLFDFDYIQEQIEKNPEHENFSLGRAFKDSLHSLKSSNEKRGFYRNVFGDQINPSNDHAFLSHSIRLIANRILMRNEKGSVSKVAEELKNVADVIAQYYQLIGKLDQYGIGISAAQEIEVDINKLKPYYINRAKLLLKYYNQYNDAYANEMKRVLESFIENPIKELKEVISEVKVEREIDYNSFEINNTEFDIFYVDKDLIDFYLKEDLQLSE